MLRPSLLQQNQKNLQRQMRKHFLRSQRKAVVPSDCLVDRKLEVYKQRVNKAYENQHQLEETSRELFLKDGERAASPLDTIGPVYNRMQYHEQNQDIQHDLQRTGQSYTPEAAEPGRTIPSGFYLTKDHKRHLAQECEKGQFSQIGTSMEKISELQSQCFSSELSLQKNGITNIIIDPAGFTFKYNLAAKTVEPYKNDKGPQGSHAQPSVTVLLNQYKSGGANIGMTGAELPAAFTNFPQHPGRPKTQEHDRRGVDKNQQRSYSECMRGSLGIRKRVQLQNSAQSSIVESMHECSRQTQDAYNDSKMGDGLGDSKMQAQSDKIQELNSNLVARPCQLQQNHLNLAQQALFKSSRVYFKSPKAFLRRLKKDVVKALSQRQDLEKTLQKNLKHQQHIVVENSDLPQALKHDNTMEKTEHSSVQVDSAGGENEELGPLGLGEGSSCEDQSPTSPAALGTTFGGPLGLGPTRNQQSVDEGASPVRLDTRFNSGYVTSTGMYIDVNDEGKLRMGGPAQDDTKTECAEELTPVESNREHDPASSKGQPYRKYEKFHNILGLSNENCTDPGSPTGNGQGSGGQAVEHSEMNLRTMPPQAQPLDFKPGTDSYHRTGTNMDNSLKFSHTNATLKSKANQKSQQMALPNFQNAKNYYTHKLNQKSQQMQVQSDQLKDSGGNQKSQQFQLIQAASPLSQISKLTNQITQQNQQLGQLMGINNKDLINIGIGTKVRKYDTQNRMLNKFLQDEQQKFMSHMKTAQDELVKKYNQYQLLNAVSKEDKSQDEALMNIQTEGSLDQLGITQIDSKNQSHLEYEKALACYINEAAHLMKVTQDVSGQAPHSVPGSIAPLSERNDNGLVRPNYVRLEDININAIIKTDPSGYYPGFISSLSPQSVAVPVAFDPSLVSPKKREEQDGFRLLKKQQFQNPQYRQCFIGKWHKQSPTDKYQKKFLIRRCNENNFENDALDQQDEFSMRFNNFPGMVVGRRFSKYIHLPASNDLHGVMDQQFAAQGSLSPAMSSADERSPKSAIANGAQINGLPMNPTIFSDRAFGEAGPRAQTTDGLKKRTRRQFQSKASVSKSRHADGFGKMRNETSITQADGVTTMPLRQAEQARLPSHVQAYCEQLINDHQIIAQDSISKVLEFVAQTEDASKDNGYTQRGESQRNHIENATIEVADKTHTEMPGCTSSADFTSADCSKNLAQSERKDVELNKQLINFSVAISRSNINRKEPGTDRSKGKEETDELTLANAIERIDNTRFDMPNYDMINTGLPCTPQSFEGPMQRTPGSLGSRNRMQSTFFAIRKQRIMQRKLNHTQFRDDSVFRKCMGGATSATPAPDGYAGQKSSALRPRRGRKVQQPSPMAQRQKIRITVGDDLTPMNSQFKGNGGGFCSTQDSVLSTTQQQKAIHDRRTSVPVAANRSQYQKLETNESRHNSKEPLSPVTSLNFPNPLQIQAASLSSRERLLSTDRKIERERGQSLEDPGPSQREVCPRLRQAKPKLEQKDALKSLEKMYMHVKRMKQYDPVEKFNKKKYNVDLESLQLSPAMKVAKAHQQTSISNRQAILQISKMEDGGSQGSATSRQELMAREDPDTFNGPSQSNRQSTPAPSPITLQPKTPTSGTVALKVNRLTLQHRNNSMTASEKTNNKKGDKDSDRNTVLLSAEQSGTVKLNEIIQNTQIQTPASIPNGNGRKESIRLMAHARSGHSSFNVSPGRQVNLQAVGANMRCRIIKPATGIIAGDSILNSKGMVGLNDSQGISPSMMSTVDKDVTGDIVDRTETALQHFSTGSQDYRGKQGHAQKQSQLSQNELGGCKSPKALRQPTTLAKSDQELTYQKIMPDSAENQQSKESN